MYMRVCAYKCMMIASIMNTASRSVHPAAHYSIMDKNFVDLYIYIYIYIYIYK